METTEPTYLLEWRTVTPKGAPGRMEFKDHLLFDDLVIEMQRVLKISCWVFVQRNDVKFPGKASR